MDRGRPTSTHVAVVIPACDERERIGATIASVAVAASRVPYGTTHDVIVVVDASSDDTAARARERLGPGAVIEVSHRSAGGARRAGVDLALRRSPCPPASTWIASTDADTIVPVDWLRQMLDLAVQGVVAVAGVVELRADEPLRAGTAERFAAAYGTVPHGLHPHVHGANLGFRGDAYLAAGGWQPLATGEDHDLWRRLAAHGPCLPAAQLRVRTSPRLRGRAPAGFAADLAALEAAG